MDQPRDPILRRLDRRRGLARLTLWWEAAWPSAWPLLGVAGVFVTLALAGLFLVLPLWLHLLVLAGFLAAACAAAWHGFRGFRLPGLAAADRRLERASGLDHRPLAVLTDRPATDDPMGLALWQAHRRRAADRLARLRIGMPRPGLAARDRHALRAGIGLAAVAALVVAGGEAPERLRRALLPALAAPPAPVPLKLEAWATPPAYTGAAPIFLAVQGAPPAGEARGNVSVPAGSRLQVSLSGAAGTAPELVLDGQVTPFAALDANATAVQGWSVQRDLTQGGHLAVRRDGTEIAGWTLSVQADAPPVVAFTEPPGRAARGNALRLPWKAEDDWGVTALRAEFVLASRPQSGSQGVEIGLPSANAKQASGTAQPDLSAHVWAGLAVRMKLVGQDGAGQQGASETVELILPERSFTHPVARVLIELRKQLSLDPGAREQVRSELDRLSAFPEAFENDTTTYLCLRSARNRLLRDKRPEAVPEVQALMWDTAVALEEGRVERTARALAQAREELRQALDEAARQAQQDQANNQQERSPEEQAAREQAQKRIEQLREAIRRHLEALAEKLQRENNEQMQGDPQQRLMDRRDMERRLERLREANRERRDRDAQQEMAELEKMLEQLEQGRSARNESAERQQRRERGQQQMGVMQDMVKRESEMLDRSHQRSDAEDRRRQTQRRTPTPWGAPPGASPLQQQQQAEREAEERGQRQDATRQQALRRALGEVMQQFGDLTGEIPAPLGRADQAMRQAQEALRGGGDARPHQEQAVKELTEGSRQMARTMRQQFGQQPGGEQEGEGEGEGEGMAEGQQQGGEGQDQQNAQGEGRDPLGRRAREAPGQAENGGDTRVPEEVEALRTRRLQDELRRRGAERERPPAELDYIDRLLKRF
jgi:uncharacterized protein (TIGR02302 family)